MPAWLQNAGAWIAIGVSLFFILAGIVMHRAFLRILKAPPPSQPNETDTHE
ncbi:hypothetical protein ACVC7V_22160 [Hydrogenophaga sp. A37]|uniref:hypothetical protein n=1 Tax=Hydrogenophaga sp. A37 TaxID=1945864 RepID=UPI0015C57846|nr:hypothetical protein [Hydrogenophaga sp. A37]